MTYLEAHLIYPLAGVGAIATLIVYGATITMTIKMWRIRPRKATK